MASPDDSGKFTTDIPKDVLDAAMDAVDKREKSARKKGAVEVEVMTVDTGDDETQEEAEADPAPAAEGDPAHEREQLEAQLEVSQAKGRELMGKIKDEHEKMLRAVADLENYKKRAAKEKEEVQRYGIEKLMRDFLPVVDNFDRALEHAHKSNDMDSLKKGVEMTRKLFEDALAKHGVKPFIALNKPFDPNFHEAMGQAESKELPPNHVVNELVRGFTLNERLLRAALVMVSKAPEAAAPASPAAPASEAKAAVPAPAGENKN